MEKRKQWTCSERRVPSPPPEDKHTEKAVAIGPKPQACEDRVHLRKLALDEPKDSPPELIPYYMEIFHA
jgi:hypothetical protein